MCNVVNNLEGREGGMTADRKTKSMTARTTVRLPEDLHHRAKLAAAWRGMKLQDFIATAVEMHL
jgi:predicted DNA binding CopG/RHH family protein